MISITRPQMNGRIKHITQLAPKISVPLFVGTQLVSSMNHACSYWSQKAMASLISTYVKKTYPTWLSCPYILFGTSTIPKPPNENTALATVTWLVSNHPHLRRHVLPALLRRSVAQAKTCPTKRSGRHVPWTKLQLQHVVFSR